MNILFIGIGNQARSQFAAAYLKKLRPDLEISCAGINVADAKGLLPVVLEVAAEDGLDLRTCIRRQLTRDQASSADYVVSFVKDSVYLRNLKIDEFWDVTDPSHNELPSYRKTRDTIRDLITPLSAALV